MAMQNMKLSILLLGVCLVTLVSGRQVRETTDAFTDVDGGRLRERRAANPQSPSGNPFLPPPPAPSEKQSYSDEEASPQSAVENMFTVRMRRNADTNNKMRRQITKDSKAIRQLRDCAEDKQQYTVVAEHVLLINAVFKESSQENDQVSDNELQRLKRQAEGHDNGQARGQQRRGDNRRGGPKKQKKSEEDSPAPDELSGGERQRRAAVDEEGAVSDAPPPRKPKGDKRRPPPGERCDCRKHRKQNETNTPATSELPRRKRAADDEEAGSSDENTQEPRPPPPPRGGKRHGPPHKGHGGHGGRPCRCKGPHPPPPPPKDDTTVQDTPETESEAPEVTRKKRDAPAETGESDDLLGVPSRGGGEVDAKTGSAGCYNRRRNWRPQGGGGGGGGGGNGGGGGGAGAGAGAGGDGAGVGAEADAEELQAYKKKMKKQKLRKNKG